MSTSPLTYLEMGIFVCVCVCVMFHFNLLMPVDVGRSFHSFHQLPVNESVIILLVFNVAPAAVSLALRR